MKMSDKVHYKYSVQVLWPEVCRNRSFEVMRNRPDLVERMNNHRVKIQNVCRLICKGQWRMDPSHNLRGVTLWFEDGADCYSFILRQPEFDWQLHKELGVVSYFTGVLNNYNIVYSPNGISIESVNQQNRA